MPELLREARRTYAEAIAARLAGAGFDDLPANAGFVLVRMENHPESAVDLILRLGVTKQAASQLIDALVLRGYLTREVNPADRRRMKIDLTDRGRAAAATIRSGVASVDDELSRMISSVELAGLRAGLIALGHIKERTSGTA
jgi:DNA-binding MarR family transcriptional regulator